MADVHGEVKYAEVFPCGTPWAPTLWGAPGHGLGMGLALKLTGEQLRLVELKPWDGR